MDTFYNNWFVHGYNNDPTITKRQTKTDKFCVEFEQNTNDILPLREAVRHNNNCIKECAGDSDIYVMLSGGYDSQSIAKTMVEDNIKFTALTFDFGRNLNEFDVSESKRLCDQYNIPLKIVSFDLIDYFSTGEFKQYCEMTHCNYQYNYVYMHGLRDINGVVVSGHGDQEFEFNDNGKYWVFEEQLFTMFEYVKHSKMDRYIRYHAFTKELWYSTYELYWKHLTNKKEHYTIKTRLYNDLGLTERVKYTGFEPYVTDILDPYKQLRHSVHRYLINRFPSSQNDIENLLAEKATGDLFLVKC